jgi:hypothetical protein
VRPEPELRRGGRQRGRLGLGALLGGRLSSDDLSAIRKICGAVRSSSEGSGIRAGVDLVAVADLGQRTTLRIIFAQMP